MEKRSGTKLKPCPKCGSKEARVMENRHDSGMCGYIDMARVVCAKCGKTGGMVDDWDNHYERIVKKLTLAELAIERWNALPREKQAELLINASKSNNSEDIRNEQIEEMANDLAQHCPDLVENCCGASSCLSCLTRFLHNAGYRKQGENVVELPCKVGDKVYQTDGVRIYESTINEITLTSNKMIFVTENIAFDKTAIGEGIFLTKAEAEQALAKMKGGESNG